jgi:hypothetical protein
MAFVLNMYLGGSLGRGGTRPYQGKDAALRCPRIPWHSKVCQRHNFFSKTFEEFSQQTNHTRPDSGIRIKPSPLSVPLERVPSKEGDV